MGNVTVVGSYIVALVMDTDRIPLEGETVVGFNYHTTHGGKGSNMAACAARLGANATFMGKIGRDPFGAEFLGLLKREGVNRHGVLYSDRLPTAVGFIIFSTSGTNVIIIDVAANGEFLPPDIAAHQDIIKASDVIISPLEIPLVTALSAAQLAKSSNVKAILNPAPACDLRGEDLSPFYALTPNETEARICLGLAPDTVISDEDLATALLDLRVENVMLTRGARGVLWASQKNLCIVPAPEVKVLDSVGAGDAFNAGLAVGLSEKLSVIESIALGVTAASLSTEKRETIESYPYRAEVDERVTEVLKQLG